MVNFDVGDVMILTAQSDDGVEIGKDISKERTLTAAAEFGKTGDVESQGIWPNEIGVSVL